MAGDDEVEIGAVVVMKVFGEVAGLSEVGTGVVEVVMVLEAIMGIVEEARKTQGTVELTAQSSQTCV